MHSIEYIGSKYIRNFYMGCGYFTWSRFSNRDLEIV
nr:MAG TPA: S-Ribosylhomocysteinase (LuxS) [Bacteriophage sp.]